MSRSRMPWSQRLGLDLAFLAVGLGHGEDSGCHWLTLTCTSAPQFPQGWGVGEGEEPGGQTGFKIALSL